MPERGGIPHVGRGLVVVTATKHDHVGLDMRLLPRLLEAPLASTAATSSVFRGLSKKLTCKHVEMDLQRYVWGTACVGLHMRHWAYSTACGAVRG